MEITEAHKSLIDYFKDKVDLSNEEIELICDAYEFTSIEKKDFLFKQGEKCKIESFVVQGAVKVSYVDEKGQEHILYFAFKDWWVGDIASFNSHDLSIMSAQALDQTFVLSITLEKKEELFTKIPKLERMFRIVTQRTLSVLQKRFFLAMSGSAKDRYIQLVHRYPKIEQLVPQYQIASYLGILPESLSRMKKQLYVSK
jgi:CRP-like cAMP-binding protein